MRSILFIALIAICSARLRSMEAEPTFGEFVKGFLLGVHEKGEFSKLADCIKEGKEIIAKYKSSYEEMKAPINAAKLQKGLPILLDASKDLLDMLKACIVEGFDTLKKLQDALSKADVNTLIKRIMQHPGQFAHEVKTAAEAFTANNFTAAGRATGNILRTLLLMHEGPPPKGNLTALVHGIAHGIGETADLKKLNPCVKEGEDILKIYQQSLGLMQQVTAPTLMKGLPFFLNATTMLMKMLDPCLEGFDKMKQLKANVTSAEVKVLVDRIMVKAKQFGNDVKTALDDFQKGNLQQVGHVFSKMFALMFSPKKLLAY